MSFLIGLGRGLQDFGQSISQGMLQREQRRREDEAIRRALEQQTVGNERAQQELMLQAEAANQNRLTGESQRANNESQRALSAANLQEQEIKNLLSIASNLPGAGMDSETAKGYLGKPHLAPFVERQSGIGSEVFDPGAAEGPTPEDSFSYRIPESEKLRIESMKQAGRAQDRAQKEQLLQMRLNTDKELAQLGNTLGYARLNQMWQEHSDRMGLSYDTLDQNAKLAAINHDFDTFLVKLKAEYGQQNPMMMLLGAGRPGGSGAKPAGSPPSTQVTPPVRPSRPTGAAPPARRGDPKLDAILGRRPQG